MQKIGLAIVFAIKAIGRLLDALEPYAVAKRVGAYSYTVTAHHNCVAVSSYVKSSQTRRVLNRAANAFRLAAQSLCRSQSALGAFYRRLRSRLGAAKANTAAAHKLARIFYQLWLTKTAYVDWGADYYEQKYQQRVVNKLQKTAQSLGFQLVPHTQPEV